jgi:hypothetical protein
MKTRILIYMVLFSLLLSSCASAAATPMPSVTQGLRVTTSQDSVAPAAPAAAPAPLMPNGANASKANTGAENVVGAPATNEKRIVLKNAELSIVVKDPVESLDTVAKMTGDMGGFVVNSQTFKRTTDDGIEVPEANITIRIPADRLTEALEKIKGLTGDLKTDVITENVTGQDVTREYTDLQSRLKNLENAEARLKEIMASATNTQDVMSVYNQLTQVTEQIEVLKGQIKYYDESSAMSAITVRIQSKEAVKPLSIGSWQPVGVARDAVQMLINTLKFMANALIWMGLFCLPIVILIGVPAFFIFKGIRRWYLRRKAEKAEKAVKITNLENKE